MKVAKQEQKSNPQSESANSIANSINDLSQQQLPPALRVAVRVRYLAVFTELLEFALKLMRGGCWCDRFS
jgi:hypothetical protein